MACPAVPPNSHADVPDEPVVAVFNLSVIYRERAVVCKYMLGGGAT